MFQFEMLIKVVIFAIVIEALTLWGRLVWEDEKAKAKKWHSLRIHHAYILIFLILWAIFQSEILIAVAIALFISDIVHHFIVLPAVLNEKPKSKKPRRKIIVKLRD